MSDELLLLCRNCHIFKFYLKNDVIINKRPLGSLLQKISRRSEWVFNSSNLFRRLKASIWNWICILCNFWIILSWKLVNFYNFFFNKANISLKLTHLSSFSKHSVSLCPWSPLLVLSSASQTEGQMQSCFITSCLKEKRCQPHTVFYAPTKFGRGQKKWLLLHYAFLSSFFSLTCFFSFLLLWLLSQKRKREPLHPSSNSPLFLPHMLFQSQWAFLLSIIKHIPVLQNEIKPVLCVSSWA